MSIVHARHLISRMLALVQVHDLVDLLHLQLALLVLVLISHIEVLVRQLLVLQVLVVLFKWSLLLKTERLEGLRCSSCQKPIGPPFVRYR